MAPSSSSQISFSSWRRWRRPPLLQQHTSQSASFLCVSPLRLLFHLGCERFPKTLFRALGVLSDEDLKRWARRVAVRLLFRLGQTFQSRRSAERTIRGWSVSRVFRRSTVELKSRTGRALSSFLIWTMTVSWQGTSMASLYESFRTRIRRRRRR